MSESVAVRLAIALTVLKHKPKQQSIPSYLLDLQSHFPLLGDNLPSSVEHESWRKHALALEKELEFFKQMREEDHVEITRLRQITSKDVSEDSGTGPQKKRTKKTGKVPEPSDGWATERAKPSTGSSNAEDQLPSSLTAVFTTLRNVVGSVSSQIGDNATGHSCLLAAITRSLFTISNFLDLQNLSRSSFPYSELNNSRIAMVSPLLVYVLRVAFPTLFRQGISTASSTAVSRLVDSVLVPLVRSFAFTSLAHITYYIDAASAKKTSRGRSKARDNVPQPPSQRPICDIRMDILTTLTEALDALSSISPAYSGYTAGIRERIALEAIRTLESLYFMLTTAGANGAMDNSAVQEETSRCMEESSPPMPRTALNRQERLEALAQKDATWYLCHILNSSATRSATEEKLGSILSGALLDSAAMLVKMCVLMDCDGAMRVQRRSVVDMACRNMILAACENIIARELRGATI